MTTIWQWLTASVQRRPLLWWVGMPLLLIAVWYVFWPAPSWSWGYRITVTLLVDGRDVSGSTVIRTRTKFMPQWLWSQSGETSCHASGGAIFIDIGEGNNVIYTLGQGKNNITSAPCALAQNTLDIRPVYSYGKDHRHILIDYLNAASSARGGAFVTEDNVWKMVTFRDVNNPDSLERVDFNNMSAVFGRDVKLKSVYLEMTADPPDFSIFQHLQWLKSIDFGHWEQRIVIRPGQDDGFTVRNFFMGAPNE